MRNKWRFGKCIDYVGWQFSHIDKPWFAFGLGWLLCVRHYALLWHNSQGVCAIRLPCLGRAGIGLKWLLVRCVRLNLVF